MTEISVSGLFCSQCCGFEGMGDVVMLSDDGSYCCFSPFVFDYAFYMPLSLGSKIYVLG